MKKTKTVAKQSAPKKQPHPKQTHPKKSTSSQTTPIKPAPEQSAKLEEQALLIAGEIFGLINKYTNDSNTAKFFLTDSVAAACYGLAGGFTSAIYSPHLTPEKIQNTTMLSLLYTLMTYGFNIYLKEHSLSTNSAPYQIPQDPEIIKKIQKKTLDSTSRGELLSTLLADKIINILITNIKNQIKTEELTIENHELDNKKFLDYCNLSMYWGYNFAREILAA